MSLYALHIKRKQNMLYNVMQFSIIPAMNTVFMKLMFKFDCGCVTDLPLWKFATPAVVSYWITLH